ncbi:MAG TPA: hypothetical protein VFB49_01640 [Patescibacteria group bacterium]|jgi:hypothetical protein|nr:hypothetical protein [Patescibacteria group bacterium]
MKKLVIGVGVLILALGATTMARTDQNGDKLPKCSGQLCKSVGCSPDVLCARGAAVVTCADVCGGH